VGCVVGLSRSPESSHPTPGGGGNQPAVASFSRTVSTTSQPLQVPVCLFWNALGLPREIVVWITTPGRIGTGPRPTSQTARESQIPQPAKSERQGKRRPTVGAICGGHPMFPKGGEARWSRPDERRGAQPCCLTLLAGPREPLASMNANGGSVRCSFWGSGFGDEVAGARYLGQSLSRQAVTAVRPQSPPASTDSSDQARATPRIRTCDAIVRSTLSSPPR
jgi:hypothetical protein